ncbi:DnaJ domain - like 10 [Theobroma cacao]|nr:DnaJ domain - like 10 [Theobroma cacao]
MARDYIDQFLIAYHVHMASQEKTNGVPDWYAVLGIRDRNADAEAIKNAFKKRALKVHPDKNSSAAADDAFKLVSEAWRVLSEPSSRQAYDQIRGSTPPSQQYECDEVDESAPKSSKEPASPSTKDESGASEQTWTNSESEDGSQSNTSAPNNQPSAYGSSGFGAEAGGRYGTSAYQDQAPSYNRAAGSANWSGTWPTNNPPPFYYAFEGAWVNSFKPDQPFNTGETGFSGGTTATGYQGPSPYNTPIASWAERQMYERPNQYCQSPPNFGAAGWSGASASSTQVQPPTILEALTTRFCPFCRTQLTLTPAGTSIYCTGATFRRKTITCLYYYR